MEAVKSGQSVFRAAVNYGVPKSTLHDRISGRSIHGKKPGPEPYLTLTEEKSLSDFLKEVASVGYGKSRSDIMRITEQVLKDKGKAPKGKSSKVTSGWLKRFLERSPELTLRRGDATANVRMDCCNDDMLKQYFDLLNKALTENDLIDSPAQIYNVDESGIPLDHRPLKIITKKGQKKVRCRTSGNKKQITVIGCVSAAGQALPPFVIFDAKRHNPEWCVGEVPGTSYGISNNGWVDSELFRGWLVKHFLKYAVASRPILLLLDGHSSHFQPDLIQFAIEHDIIVCCLPPHTTHETQPLDASVFKPLKKNWSDVCHAYMQDNPGKVITKFTFSALFNTAWTKSMTISNICSGFRKCGIYPFNPGAVSCGNLPSNTCESNQPDFSAEKIALFERRYEEEYDIADPEYEKWLQYYHPSDSHHNTLINSHDESQRSSNVNSDPIIHDEPNFSAEKISLFERRYEEGYNVADPEYEKWLEHYHPLDSHSGDYASRCSDNNQELLSASIEDLQVGSQCVADNESDDSYTSIGKQFSGDQSVQSQSPINCTSVEPVKETSLSISKLPAVNEGGVSDDRLKHISKYLVQYVPVSAPKRTRKQVSGARILTSAECVALFKEKEDKKKKELEDKERRKQERKLKRNQKAGSKSKKKTTSVTSSSTRTDNSEKASMPTSSRYQRSSKGKGSKSYIGKNIVTSSSSSLALEDETILEKTISTVNTTVGTRSKRNKSKKNGSEEEIDINRCCVCYQTYIDDTTGLGWVECACSRWLHEECIQYDVTTAADGRELLCPFCCT